MRFFTNTRRTLMLIILLAVLLRIGIAVYLGNDIKGDQQTRVMDQISYNRLAQSILAGRGYSFEIDWYPFTKANTPTAHWSFLYPLFLAAIYGLIGYLPLAARVIQILIVTPLVALLLYRLGKRLFGETAGLLAAALGAVYLFFVYYDATLMTEPFFILCVLASMDLAMQISEAKPAPLSLWVKLGLILGVASVLRQTILLWLPFLLGWLVWAGPRPVNWKRLALSMGIVLAIMAAWILPWTARNYIVYHGFLPLNSNAGFAVYSANHPDQGTHFIQDYVAPLPADLLAQNLNEAQWNTQLTARAIQFVLQDPVRYLLLTLDKLTVFFDFWPVPESSTFSNMVRLFSFGLYLPFFLLGLYLSRKTWRRSSLIYLFAIIFSAMHVLTWASARYRLPIDACLMPFAALALIQIYHWLPVKKLAFNRG